MGALALKRGFPRTHRFAQPRSVFAVAAHRCAEWFDVTDSVSLCWPSQASEEEFDAGREHWLDSASNRTPFFERVEGVNGNDLVNTLRSLEVVSADDVEGYAPLRRTAEGRAVPLPSPFASTNADVALLTLGFARGERGALAVPYAYMTGCSRVNVVSSSTTINGTMIEETYAVVVGWDFAQTKREKLDRLRSSGNDMNTRNMEKAVLP